MRNREDILRDPEYWLQDAQLELFEQVSRYLKDEKITQTELANRLNVSKGYISQVLNGNFNHTFRKLIEISMAIGKIPEISYVPIEAKLTEEYVSQRVYEFHHGVKTETQVLHVAYKDESNITAA